MLEHWMFNTETIKGAKWTHKECLCSSKNICVHQLPKKEKPLMVARDMGAIQCIFYTHQIDRNWTWANERTLTRIQTPTTRTHLVLQIHNWTINAFGLLVCPLFCYPNFTQHRRRVCLSLLFSIRSGALDAMMSCRNCCLLLQFIWCVSKS